MFFKGFFSNCFPWATLGPSASYVYCIYLIEIEFSSFQGAWYDVTKRKEKM